VIESVLFQQSWKWTDFQRKIYGYLLLSTGILIDGYAGVISW